MEKSILAPSKEAFSYSQSRSKTEEALCEGPSARSLALSRSGMGDIRCGRFAPMTSNGPLALRGH